MKDLCVSCLNNDVCNEVEAGTGAGRIYNTIYTHHTIIHTTYWGNDTK